MNVLFLTHGAFEALLLQDGPNLLLGLFLAIISFICSLLLFLVVLVFLIARVALASPRMQRFAMATSIAGLLCVVWFAQLTELYDFFDSDASANRTIAPILSVAAAMLFFGWCTRAFCRRLQKAVA